jgi:uncharacterized membrane protein
MEFALYGFLLLAVLAGPWVLAVLALRRARRAQERIALLEARFDTLARGGAPAWSGLTAVVPAPAPLDTAPVPPAAAPSPSVTSPPPPPPAAPPPVARQDSTAPPASFEEKVALVWFTRLGALTFLLGAGWFFKYAVDNEWIGPLGRVVLGALVGAGMLALAEAKKERLRALYLHAVLGTGVAVLFAAAYSSHALYDLVPAAAAFAAVALIALLGGALALRHRGELVLVLALVGGLAAPVVLSTGEDRAAGLFAYLLVLTGLTLWAAAREGFRVAPWFAVAGVTALFAAWYERYFDVRAAPALPGGGYAYAPGAYHALAARAVPLLAVAAFLAAWLLVARSARRRDGAGLFPIAMELAALLLGHAGAAVLLLDRPLLLGAALVALGALSERVLARAGYSSLLAAPLAVSFAALLSAREGLEAGERHALLLSAAAWGALYLGASALALLRRREEVTAARLLAACAPALGVLAVGLLTTGEEEQLLRAVVAAGAGAAALALGAGLLARARRPASLLLGEALGLFAAAAAFLLSGATVTLVWAALAAVVARLAADARDRDWLAGAALLFAAALVRLLAVDVPAPEHEVARFVSSLGSLGHPAQRLLLNPRSLAFAGTAAALFLAARDLSRAPERAFRPAAAVALGAGHLVLLGLVVLEVRAAAVTLPALPEITNRAAMNAWGSARAHALWGAAGRLDMWTTLVLGVYAALLVGIGFAARERVHRWLGLGLFAVTLGKLALHDVWRMERPYQIAVFLAIGALLLGASFLYARYGRGLVEILRGGGTGAALAALAAGALAAGSADALDVRPFSHAAAVEGVTRPGLWRFEVPFELSGASAGGGFSDVRLTGPGGEEVPWLLRPVSSTAPERSLAAALVDPVVLADGTARAVLDLGAAHGRHSEVRLELAGDEFLRRARIEVSNDGRRWGLAAEGGRVWSVRGESGARGLALRYPASDMRFLRVTLLPAEGDRVRITGGRVFFSDPPRPAQVRERGLAIGRTSRDPAGRRTLVELALDAPAAVASELRLAIATPAFERRARVLANDGGDVWYGAGSGVLWRSPGAGPGERQGLAIPVALGSARRLRLEIEDGDASPLAIQGVALAWRPDEIVFRAESSGPHTLLVGDRATAAPAYDLAAVLARGSGAKPGEARLGALGPNPGHVPPAAARLPFTERHRGVLVALLVALLAVLAVWTVRLLRRGGARA